MWSVWVSGKPQATGLGVGDNTIAPDPSLTPDKITKFATAVKPYANLSLASSGGTLSYKNLGDTCAAKPLRHQRRHGDEPDTSLDAAI